MMDDEICWNCVHAETCETRKEADLIGAHVDDCESFGGYPDPPEKKSGRMNKLSVSEMLEKPMAKQCLRCPAVSVCKYVDEAVQSDWAEGCRYFRQILEKAKQAKLEEAIKID